MNAALTLHLLQCADDFLLLSHERVNLSRSLRPAEGGAAMTAHVERYVKCGADCSRCPWSLAVHTTFDDEDAFADYRRRCKRVLGYSPSENVFRDCVGCQTPDGEIPQGARVPLKNCLVRRCVDRLGIRNCAYCSRFPCGYIRDRGDEWGREKIEAKHDAPISEDDYATFVEAFEGSRHLHEIRAMLDPSQIRGVTSLDPGSSTSPKTWIFQANRKRRTDPFTLFSRGSQRAHLDWPTRTPSPSRND